MKKTLAIVGLAGALVAAMLAGGPGRAQAATRCGTIDAGGLRGIKITRQKGRFPCRDARALFRDFYNHRGVRRHCARFVTTWRGRPNCYEALAYYTIKPRWPRWRIGTGAGAAGAITGRRYRRSRDYLVAEVPPQ